MSKMNWTEGAGSTQDQKSAGLNSKGAGTVSGETGSTAKPSHLESDSTLKSYISGIQSDGESEYNDMWGKDYHGGNCYPSVGSKTKQGMD